MLNKKRVLILVLIVMLIVVFILGGVVIGNARRKADFDKQISSGERYLKEKNYEQAILAFEKAAKVNEKDADTYLKLAEAYLGAGKAGQAIEWLKKGYDRTKDERIYHQIEQIAALSEEDKADTESPVQKKNALAKKAYLKMVRSHSYPELKSKIEMDVGLPYITIKNDVIVDDFNDQHKLNMQLLDIDGDGLDEFILQVENVYQSQSLICVYNYKDDKVNYVDAFSAYPEPDHFFVKPFDQVGEGTPILWHNREMKSLYSVSFYDMTDKHKQEEFYAAEYENNKLTKRYLVYDDITEGSSTDGVLYQIGEDTQEIVSEEDYIKYRETYFTQLGEVVKFDSYTDFISKYDK
ncbi:MAG: tetratricopeptide repeat protein [bacterium]|nr:tetratricopeptide repeat protein [bacterium]